MIEIPVLIPAPNTSLGIDPASGIVGTYVPDPHCSGEHRWLIDYEGNRHHALNIVTFADRVEHAYDRQARRYPTIARMEVAASQLVHVATFYAEYGRVEVCDAEVPHGQALYKLADWLGHVSIHRIDGDAMQRELTVSRTKFIHAR